MKKSNGFPIFYEIRWNGNYWHRPELAVKNAANLRKFIGLLQKHGLKADFFFTGLAAQQLNQVAPDVVQMIRDFRVPIGHHGANREPKPQPFERCMGKNWDEAVRAMLDYETHAIDPDTGELDYTRIGGLAGIQTIFGKPVTSTGRNPWGPMLRVLKQFGLRMCIGLPGQLGDINQEHVWFMGVLNMPERQVPGISHFRDFTAWTDTGKSPLKESEKAIQTLDRSTFVQVRVQPFGHDNDPLTRGTMWGPTAQEIPAKLQRTIWRCIDKTFAFLAAHKEWMNITLDDTVSFAKDDRNRRVTSKMLEKAVSQLTSVTTTLPDYINLGDDSLSLADTFQALAFSLAQYADNGSLPKSVDVKDILGPTYLYPDMNAGVSLNAKEMLKTVADVSRQLGDQIPHHVTISELSVDVNPGQFLVMMADMYESLNRGVEAKPAPPSEVSAIPKKAKTLPVWHAPDVPTTGTHLNNIGDLSRLQYWTLKPVRWDMGRIMAWAEAARRGRTKPRKATRKRRR